MAVTRRDPNGIRIDDDTSSYNRLVPPKLAAKPSQPFAIVPLDDFSKKRALDLKYSNPTSIRRAIFRYFHSRKEQNIPHTIAGLALALGTTTPRLRELASGADAEARSIVGEVHFKIIVRDIKKALQMLADVFEADMRNRSQFQIANIFLLKNLGYSDNSDNRGLTIKDNTGQTIAVQVVRYAPEQGNDA